MRFASASRHVSTLWFLGMTAAIYAAAWAVVGHMSRLDAHAGVLATALTLDLVVVVPLGFYLLVVRRRGLPVVTVVPVLVLSALAASRILPADRQQTLGVLEVLAVPLELGLIGWIAWRAAGAWKRARRGAEADPLVQLKRAAFELTRNDRVSAMFASEAAVFVYAIGSWRAWPHAPSGTSAFSHHRRSGQGAIVLAFILVMLVEGLAVHMLLRNWSALAAWILTIGTAYGALWLIADYRASVLRPILVDDRSILVRAGLRFTLHVPRARIAAVGREKPAFGKECANLTMLATPTHWITLAEPMLAEGPYGFRRRVRAIGIVPDEPWEFDGVFAGRSN